MMTATTNLPSDTPESAKEAMALLEPFFKAWRDSDPEGMVARIADGKVDYIDYCKLEFSFVVSSKEKAEIWVSYVLAGS